MEAQTIKASPDASEREDAARWLTAALAAVEAGEWSSAKCYMNAARGVAIDVLKGQA